MRSTSTTHKKSLSKSKDEISRRFVNSKPSRISWAAEHEEQEVQRWINNENDIDDSSASTSVSEEDIQKRYVVKS